MQTYEHFHEAMATKFSLKTYQSDKVTSNRVAGLCFAKLDELELKMSRFVADSDISRINRMKAGDQLMLEEEVYECLRHAISIHQDTGGLFDAGIAEMSDIYRGYQSGQLNDHEFGQAIDTAMAEKAAGSFYLHPEEQSIYCLHPGLQFDLGGIGKGYALDLLAAICHENDVRSFVLSAGGSTILVHTHEELSYQLASRKEKKEVLMSCGSVSASGTGNQGDHIFNPVTGQNEDHFYERLWIGASTACFSDAYGTAFFLMKEEEIRRAAEDLDAIRWIAVSEKGTIRQLYSSDKQLV